jgi:hypothetical protein
MGADVYGTFLSGAGIIQPKTPWSIEADSSSELAFTQDQWAKFYEDRKDTSERALEMYAAAARNTSDKFTGIPTFAQGLYQRQEGATQPTKQSSSAAAGSRTKLASQAGSSVPKASVTATTAVATKRTLLGA